MSKYTTGEIAKLCGVTVRTVQYYDTRGILVPSELSEGGRRLFSEDDLKRLRIICFLRDMDLPIDAISQILQEEHPEKVISLLIEQHESALTKEISDKQEKLDKLRELKKGLKSKETFSLESIGDVALFMESKKKMKRMRRIMLCSGIPLALLQAVSVVLFGLWRRSRTGSLSAFTISDTWRISARSATRYFAPGRRKRSLPRTPPRRAS